MPILATILNILISLAIAMVSVAACVVLIVTARRALRVNADRDHTLRLENRGNTRSVFRLWVESLEPGLAFTLLYRNASLTAVYEAAPAQPGVAIESGEAGQPALVNVNKKNSPTPPRQGPNAAVKAGQAAAGKAGILASLLGTIGNLIPGAAGRKLKAQAEGARAVQTNTTRTINAPQEIKRQVGDLKDDSSRLVGRKDTPGAQALPGDAPPSGHPKESQPVASEPPRLLYFVTPEVPAGQTLEVTLRVGTIHARYPQGSFVYTVHIEQVAPDFPEILPSSIDQRGTSVFAPIPFWRYWLSPFASALVIVTGLSVFVFGLMQIWR